MTDKTQLPPNKVIHLFGDTFSFEPDPELPPQEPVPVVVRQCERLLAEARSGKIRRIASIIIPNDEILSERYVALAGSWNSLALATLFAQAEFEIRHQVRAINQAQLDEGEET